MFVCLFFAALLTAPVKTTASHEQEIRLLFQESLEGSLLVERSVEGGVSLKWSRTSRESLALLRKISEGGSEIVKSNGCQSSELKPCSTNVCETIVDSENSQDKHESGSARCNQDELSMAHVLERGNVNVQSLADCKQGNTNQKIIQSVEDSEHKDLSTDGLKTVDTFREENGSTNEHSNLKETEPGLSGVSDEKRAFGSTENLSRNSQTDNVLKKLDKDACGEIGSSHNSPGSPKKVLCTESNGKSRVASRYSNEVLSIEAPFINPRLFQKPGADSFSPLPQSTVQLLISTNYVIVAILPLMAYVFYHEKDEWKSLLFPCAVQNCCILQGKQSLIIVNRGKWV